MTTEQGIQIRAEAVRDLISGVIVLVFCTALYVSIPYQVVIKETGNGMITPASVPTILLVTIGTLAAFLTVRAVLVLRGNLGGSVGTDETTDRRGLAYVGITATILVVYAIVIPWLGYLLSTGMALGFLALLFGQRVQWQILVLMVLSPPILFYFFRYALFVLLPKGSLFG